MQTHSETWSSIVANGDFRLNTVAVINGVRYSTITAPVIKKALLSDKTLSVGNCIAATLEFSVLTNNVIPKSAKVVIECQVANEAIESEWLKFGTFWVAKRTIDRSLDEKLITFECYDAMLKGNQPYVDDEPALNWPKSMQKVVTRCAAQMGVEIDERTVINTGDDYIIYKPDDDMTLLDILQWIGEVHGGNWIITQRNKLRLVPLVTRPPETYYIVDENYNRIQTSSGDNLVWKSGSDAIPSDSIVNVPIVMGDITTGKTVELSEAADLGTYTKLSGNYMEDAADRYFSGRAGKGVDSAETTRSYNASGTKVVVVFTYDMPISIPSNAQIIRVYVEVNGHAEGRESDTGEFMSVQLISGETGLSDVYDFKTSGTSNTTITLECNTIPTVEQLSAMKLQCRLGYGGGAINGATACVEYKTANTQIVTGVTMIKDRETVYTAGTDDGIVLTIENEFCTQNLCNALYAQVNGIEYEPFEITQAVFDPTAELGDAIIAGDLVRSVLYNSTVKYDTQYNADVSAPGEDELESEYPVVTPTQRTRYAVSALQEDNKDMHSEIRQKADRIELAGYVTFESLETEGETEINGANITTGYIDANRIAANSISVQKLSQEVQQTVAYRQQTIYLTRATDDYVAPNTTWVTRTEAFQGMWTTTRPVYHINYPYLYTAVQRQTLEQSGGSTCSCTTPEIDKTTTVIDGGHITTGSIDAARIQTGEMSASRIKGGTLTLGGNGNSNGWLKLVDANDNVVARLTVYGVEIEKGSIDIRQSTDYGLYISSYGNLSIGPKPAVDGQFDGNNCPFQVLNTGQVKVTSIDVYGLTGQNPLTYYGAIYGAYAVGPGSSMYLRSPANTNRIWLGDNYIEMSTALNMYGDFNVYNGTKSRVADTEEYGKRLLYCYETPSPMFGDVGDGTIGEDGKCYVWFDPVFAQTVSNARYQVFLQPYGAGECFVEERKSNCFVVSGKPNLEFGWEIKAKQKDFDQRRLEPDDRRFKVPSQTYGEDANNYIAQLRNGRIVA